MNNQSTQFDILPKLISNQHKLLEPAFIKNTQMRFSQNESQILPHIPRRSSMMQGNSKQMVVHRLMGSFDFNNRHFGAACDRGFQGLSNYHISQKFGQFSVKLRPLERSVIDVTEGDEIEVVPKEERDHYKRIYKHESMPVLAMVKTFQIDWLPDPNQEVNKKTSTSLQMSFHTTLSILNTFANTLEFFEKNLQLLERNTVALKQKGVNHLTQKIDKFSHLEFPVMQIIKNSNGLGYFKISYPIIEIYFQQYQYMGIVNLSANKLYDLVKNNFVELEYIVKDFPIDKTKFKVDIAPVQEKRNSINNPILENILEKQEEPQPQIVNEQIKHQQTQQLAYNDLGLIIIEKIQEFPEKVLQKRQIKQIVQKDEKSFYVVDFLPPQLLIKEKVSQRIIKMYSPTLREFNDLLYQLQQKAFNTIIEEYVETQFEMSPEAFDYKDFKKGTKIKFTLPKCEELLSEITEQHLNNGLTQQWQKEIEINNKDLQIIVEPCVFEIYNQVTCHTEKRICSSKDLTKIMQNKYMIQFKLI